MPELPEVETVARSLRGRIVGQGIRGVSTSGKALRLARPIDAGKLRRLCSGGRFEEILRRGKYLILGLDRGRVLVHLGMSGQLRLQASTLPPPPHTHVTFHLENGSDLRFIDPRRFGWVEAGTIDGGFAQLAGLGPDPLDELTASGLGEILAGSKAPVKSVLLDQKRIAGLGNIYVCEALYATGIHPAAPARAVAGKAPELLKSIVAALRLGLRNRGTSLRDYVDADGRNGTNAKALRVYGREGEPCLSCGTAIERRTDGGRSSFFCPRCQR